MNLEAFLHDLHFDIDRMIHPEGWEVDWEDAPLPYKLYRGLPVVPLSSEVPLTLTAGTCSTQPNLLGIGHFLWYAFGLTQFAQSEFAFAGKEQGPIQRQFHRRFVPAGGGLYPNELYVYLKIKDLPTGVYHYDVAHHRLVLLREGQFDSYLIQALGNQCDMAACFGAVFVSTMFWKNFFKYHNFAYRLQGLDAGVLIGQLLEVAKQFNFTTGVYFQFLDRAINHLLGISELEESVYAVIPLSQEPFNVWFITGDGKEGTTISAAELCQELTAVHHHHYVRSQRMKEYPMLIKMNEASMLESVRSFRQMDDCRGVNYSGRLIPLPDVKRLKYDLSAASMKRYSPGLDFVLRKVDLTQLAMLLHEATASFSYQNDLDGTQKNPKPRVSLFVNLYGIEGIPDGAYQYDSAVHALRLIRSGDHRLSLQLGYLYNVNLFQVPICLHVAGDQNHLIPTMGYRGYRIQQMEAGMLTQRLSLIACAIGLGSHVILGFDVNTANKIFGMAPQAQTSLVQLPIGSHRPPCKLEGSLRS
ncbi:SagB family peptide dehydrogenase [Fodinisporobacter ferrooxydans]|uniref:SagB family peptide dehydrogenase n=1 Tax=Fodinisporobacter ferrooxydans TaxID=2901836 RepID=A0ABY4CGD2_9BACL|nr:SagB family peptide dehydrogenase [Alicyclobacillaceae bacterium MYW30-H2]